MKPFWFERLKLLQDCTTLPEIMSTPQPLKLCTFVSKSQMDECIEKNMLEIPKDWWHIGLRESPEEAMVRAGQVGEPVNKDSHVILMVIFSPLGVAHFTTTCEDQTYHFQPILHKICNRYATRDKGVWHFIRNLPLSMTDDQGNQLVSSEWMEIM